jgi:hypothetical protein
MNELTGSDLAGADPIAVRNNCPVGSPIGAQIGEMRHRLGHGNKNDVLHTA